MQEILVIKLHEYIRENNPDMLTALREKNAVTGYLHEKILSIDSLLIDLLAANTPTYIIEERCMDALTRDLRPSRFNYLKLLLEEKFPSQYEQFSNNGILTTELINMIHHSQPVFEETRFSEENENDKNLQDTITASVQAYLLLTEMKN